MEKKNIPQMGEFELSFNFSEDNKYLVVNLKELEEKKYEETKKTSEKKGIKKAAFCGNTHNNANQNTRYCIDICHRILHTV